MSDEVGSAHGPPFEGDAEQRRIAAELGVWIFLATEILFFGAMFACYAVGRYIDPIGFVHGAKESEIFFGTVNTVILITSGLTMALAVKLADEAPRATNWLLIATIALAIAFLVVKALEYRVDLEHHFFPSLDFAMTEQGAYIYWSLYWMMTGTHAVHVSIGIGCIVFLYVMRLRGGLSEHSNVLLGVALYWGLVDVMWLFIYPLLYLVGRA